MAIQTVIYAGVTAMTLTGASLASWASRQGTAIVNTANKYIDAQISGNITTGAAVSSGDAYLLLYGSDATTVSAPATGSDGAITIPSFALAQMGMLLYGNPVPLTDLIFLTRVACTGIAAGTAIGYPVLQVSQAFGMGGLALPPQWGLVLVNGTGQALSATATVNNYNGITQNIA